MGRHAMFDVLWMTCEGRIARIVLRVWKNYAVFDWVVDWRNNLWEIWMVFQPVCLYPGKRLSGWSLNIWESEFRLLFDFLNHIVFTFPSVSLSIKPKSTLKLNEFFHSRKFFLTKKNDKEVRLQIIIYFSKSYFKNNIWKVTINI